MKSLRWICCFFAIAWLGAVFVDAQTIADAARIERERRKAIDEKKSESVPAVAETGTPHAAAPAPSTNKAKPAIHSGPTDSNGHDEKYWRPKFDAARLGLQRAEANLKSRDLKVADLTSRLNRIDNRTPAIRAELERATRDQGAARKAVADAKQKIADLEDALRRAGGLPGWSRPL